MHFMSMILTASNAWGVGAPAPSEVDTTIQEIHQSYKDLTKMLEKEYSGSFKKLQVIEVLVAEINRDLAHLESKNDLVKELKKETLSEKEREKILLDQEIIKKGDEILDLLDSMRTGAHPTNEKTWRWRMTNY